MLFRSALGAQFRQALRITVPAQVPTTTQVPTSATAPRTNGQATAAPETRVVTQVNPRQFAETLQSVQGVESLPVASLPKRDTVTPPSERLAPSAAPEVDPVQRLVQSVDAMVGANSRRDVTREAWLEACRQERALTSGRESDPTLKQLRRVRDRLVGAANANALRWGTEAFFEGGSELGRAVISEVRSRADELRRGAGTALKEGRLVANGGRVLAVTALGGTIREARDRAYRAVDRIDWPEGFCRRDIGWRAC